MLIEITSEAAPGLVGEPERLPVDGRAECRPDAEAQLRHPVPVLAVARGRQYGRHGEDRRVEVTVPRRLVAWKDEKRATAVKIFGSKNNKKGLKNKFLYQIRYFLVVIS